MKIKLIKLAQELNSSISDIARFLSENGREVIEDANETLDEESAEFVRDNLIIKVIDENENQTEEHINEQQLKTPVYSRQDPIELKIVEAASGKAKFIERIIGYTEYKWQYFIYRYRGLCSKPIPFDAFDEVICGILLRRKVTFEELGRILGLHVNEDIAEFQVLADAIKSLVNDGIIFREDNLVLTPKGLEYIQKGAKLSIYERDFDIYIDKVGDIKKNVRSIFSKLRSEKIGLNKKEEDNNLSLNQIREYAIDQAPEVHFPDNDFILQQSTFKSLTIRQATVWVVLLENFRDRTLRALVYDEESNQIIKELSDSLSANEYLKKQLLETMIAESKHKEFQMEFTTEEKSPSQIEDEKVLIAQQEAYDTAVKEKDSKRAEQIRLQSKSEKRFFGSLEFEVELKRLFDTTSGDLWVISPWIRYVTHRRIPFFERYMKKGGRVFVAYSKPEKPDDVMAAPEQLAELQELEQKYNNFYLYQLPAFHYKYVFLQNVENPLFYTGSYNILSYFAELNKVRNEQMSKIDWSEEIQTSVFLPILEQFGQKYIGDAQKKMEEIISHTPDILSLVKINAFAALKFDNLLPFIGKGSKDLDEKYQQLITMHSNHADFLRSKYLASELESLKKRIQKLDNSLAGIKERKDIREAMTELESAFPVIIDSNEFKNLQAMLKEASAIKVDISSKFKKK